MDWAGVECGSKIYKGSSSSDRVVTVTDHRGRYCRDVVPAQIVVEEATAAARARTLLSEDSFKVAPVAGDN